MRNINSLPRTPWSACVTSAPLCVCERRYLCVRSRVCESVELHAGPPLHKCVCDPAHKRKSFDRLPKRLRYKTNGSPLRRHDGASLLWNPLLARTCLKTRGFCLQVLKEEEGQREREEKKTQTNPSGIIKVNQTGKEPLFVPNFDVVFHNVKMRPTWIWIVRYDVDSWMPWGPLCKK